MTEDSVLLAVHQGVVHRCAGLADGMADLVAPPGTVPSSDFERMPDGTFVQRISASLPEALYRFVARGVRHPDPGQGYLAPDAEGQLWHSLYAVQPGEQPQGFPVFVRHTGETRTPNTDAIVTDLSVAVAGGAPKGWQKIAIECLGIGSRLTWTAAVTLADGGEQQWSPPVIVAHWFQRLRLVSYRPAAGSWFTARYQLERGAPASIEYGFDAWKEVTAAEALDELRRLPRRATEIPAELAKNALIGYELAERDKALRPPTDKPFSLLARLFDGLTGNDRPYFYRQAIADSELDAILSFLESGHVVLSSRGFSPDLLHPERESKVPMAFLTDGRWVWPAAIAYYLREHDVPPAPDFVQYIRSVKYEVPRSLPRLALDRASALAMGRPETQTALREDYDRAAYAISDMAARFRISKRHYSNGGLKDQAWCMVREGDRWAAFWYSENERRRELEHVFDSVGQAATYIMGQLWQNYPNLQREPGELLDAAEVLDHPIPPSPPLENFEKFQYVTVTDLDVEQFGPPSSNVVYAPGTRAEQIVPPLFGETAPRRLRLTGEWTVVSCLTKASGAKAYVLPQATDAYLRWGQIVDLAGAGGV